MATSDRETAAASLIHEFLRPQEILRAIVTAREQVQSPAGPSSNTSSSRTSSGSGASSVRNRVLAVVTNEDNGGEYEEGCIFVFKVVVTWNELREPNSRLILLSTYALDNGSVISLAQHKQANVQSSTTPSKHQPSPTLMEISVQQDGRTTNYVSPLSESLRFFISECRRLQKLDETNQASKFLWVSQYRPIRSSRRLLPPLFPRPDLRTLLKPAHERLSVAFAGQPGDEELDMMLIRDEWIRKKLNDCEDEYSSSRTLRIRLGTFNVNGKTPSQDLSPWVRPQRSDTIKQAHTRSSSIPPLKPTSPLEVRLDELNLGSQPNVPSQHASTKFSDSDVFESKEPDVLVFGFQELDLSTEALLYSYTTTREDMWLDAIFAGLGEVREQYVKLASKQLVGMLIIVIAHKVLLPDFSDVRLCAIGRGIMGVMGNKGATAIRFKYRSTVLSFVNSHLAAYDEFVERRNADFHELSRRMVFDSTIVGGTSTAPLPAAAARAAGEKNTTRDSVDVKEVRTSYESANEGSQYDSLMSGPEALENVYQSDFLFWMVNLNYRIDLPDADVRELIASEPRERNIRDLLEHDQLSKAMAAGHAFEGFSEGRISHNPSYRFNSDLATDSFGYDTKRRPAYTDRILYMAAQPANLRQLSYSSHLEVTMSDHRPVSAEFDVRVRQVDRVEYERHATDLVHSLPVSFGAEVGWEDGEVQAELPKLKVEETMIDFGEVRYKQAVVKSISLSNVGKVPAAYRLVGKSETDFLPLWLAITPRMGIILPGERDVLTLTVYVDDKSANKLNLSTTHLDDIIILHTERGKDHFVAVTGTFLPTCFANDLSMLVRLPGPIRDVESRRQIASEQLSSAPREVMRLINWMMTTASDTVEHQPFLERGEDAVISYIRECLDTGDEFAFDKSYSQTQIVRSVADALMQFLASLPVPIIPPSFHGRCELVGDQNEAFEVVSELPGPSLNVWISLTAYLHYITQQDKGPTPESGISLATSLASIFAPILLRDSSRVGRRISPIVKRQFILLFIK